MRVVVSAFVVAACADTTVVDSTARSTDESSDLAIGPPCAFIDNAPPVVEGGALHFDVRLSQPATAEVRVAYCLSQLGVNGTIAGASNDDFLLDVPCTAPREIVFAPGSAHAVIDVATFDDAVREEPVEQMFVRLMSVAGSKVVPTEGSFVGEARGFIFDNDHRSCELCGTNKNCVALSQELGRRAVEGDGIPFTYVMCNPDPSAPNASQLISYNTFGGSAAVACPQPSGRCDFFPQSGSFTLTASSPSHTIVVPTNEDHDFESLESIQFGGFPGFLTGYILDDDYTNAVCNVSDVAVAENAGPATFTIELARPDLGEWPVSAATQDGTATAPSDYTATAGQLTFAGTLATRAVPIAPDFTVEPDETFTLRPSVVGGGDVAVLDPSGTATIVNDDAPGLQIDDILVHRPRKMDPSEPATFTVHLTPTVPNVVTVDWTTVDGTAIAGVDYIARSGTCVFAANAPACPITIDVLSGRLDGQRRVQFFVDLSNAQGSTIVRGRGTATIGFFR